MSVSHKGPAVREKLTEEVLALLEQSKNEDPEERNTAYFEMGELEDPADEVIDALIAGLLDKENRTEAAGALEKLATPRAIEPLLQAVQREQTENPRFAFGVEFPSLCRALGACGNGDARAIELLVSCLVVQKSMYAALGAFDALVHMGPNAAPATNALEALTTHESGWLRAHAHRALLAIDGNTQRHLPALCALLLNHEGGGAPSASAKLALQALGPAVLPLLEELAAKGPAKQKKAINGVIEGIRAQAERRAKR